LGFSRRWIWRLLSFWKITSRRKQYITLKRSCLYRNLHGVSFQTAKIFGKDIYIHTHTHARARGRAQKLPAWHTKAAPNGKMLQGMYSAIYGEVNVSVWDGYVLQYAGGCRASICFISVTLKIWSDRKLLDPTTYVFSETDGRIGSSFYTHFSFNLTTL
jgi:hypothetical protein